MSGNVAPQDREAALPTVTEFGQRQLRGTVNIQQTWVRKLSDISKPIWEPWNSTADNNLRGPNSKLIKPFVALLTGFLRERKFHDGPLWKPFQRWTFTLSYQLIDIRHICTPTSAGYSLCSGDLRNCNLDLLLFSVVRHFLSSAAEFVRILTCYKGFVHRPNFYEVQFTVHMKALSRTSQYKWMTRK
jgi:hypothetical protein